MAAVAALVAPARITAHCGVQLLGEVRYTGGAVGLEEARRAVRRLLQPAAPSPRCVYAVELVLEEWLSNVARHAGHAGAPVLVEVQVSRLSDGVRLQFEDRAPAFDPTLHPSPSRPSGLDDAAVGGLGIEMMRRCSRTMTYSRDGAVNRLTVTISA